MSAWNRAKALWAYLRGHAELDGLPVEYIVETTTRCNLHCPMCPRARIGQPKADMPPAIFERLVAEAAGAAEHMMLVGLGEPLLDPYIIERIELCARHGVATLLSTNGVLLDEAAASRLLDSPLEHLTLSFDGATKQTFEFYRRGARFEAVRDNFVRLARMKKQRGSSMQLVAQLVRLEGNRSQIEDFRKFWRSVEGIDLVRVKDDETGIVAAGAGALSADRARPCHYLWRGPLYVRYNGDVHPCCQSYMLGGQAVGRIGEQPLARIVNSEAMQRMRRAHAEGRGGEIEVCARCRASIPHPVLAAGSLLLHGRTVRRLLPLVERVAGRLRMLRPPPAG